MKVILAPLFRQHYVHFPRSDKLKIAEFIQHVELYGLTGLKGRNKSSDHVPTDDPDWANKVSYAQHYRLYHYHIGIPYYSKAKNGDFVSEYLLHYILGDDFIKIVDLSPHPPFQLPDIDYLK